MQPRILYSLLIAALLPGSLLPAQNHIFAADSTNIVHPDAQLSIKEYEKHIKKLSDGQEAIW